MICPKTDVCPGIRYNNDREADVVQPLFEPLRCTLKHSLRVLLTYVSISPSLSDQVLV